MPQLWPGIPLTTLLSCPALCWRKGADYLSDLLTAGLPGFHEMSYRLASPGFLSCHVRYVVELPGILFGFRRYGVLYRNLTSSPALWHGKRCPLQPLPFQHTLASWPSNSFSWVFSSRLPPFFLDAVEHGSSIVCLAERGSWISSRDASPLSLDCVVNPPYEEPVLAHEAQLHCSRCTVRTVQLIPER
jgi:hypothetical protein